MKTIRTLFLCLITVTLMGCGTESSEDEITLKDLEGSWNASSFTHTSKSNSSDTFEFVANNGEVRFTVLSGGRVRIWITLGDFSDEWDSQMSISGDQLTITPVETTRDVLVLEMDMNESGNTLTLTNNDDSFDFTLNGEPEVPSVSVGVFNRQ